MFFLRFESNHVYPVHIWLFPADVRRTAFLLSITHFSFKSLFLCCAAEKNRYNNRRRVYGPLIYKSSLSTARFFHGKVGCDLKKRTTVVFLAALAAGFALHALFVFRPHFLFDETFYATER